jgi:hypothetical protein
MAKNRRNNVLVAVVGALLLGLGGFSTSATAQTVNTVQALTHVASILGNVPNGVTGLNVSATCRDDLVPGSTETKSVVLTLGGGSGTTSLSLGPNTICFFRAEIAGSANFDFSRTKISVTVDSSDLSLTRNLSPSGLLVATTSSAFVSGPATIRYTVTFPRLVQMASSVKLVGVVPTNLTGAWISAICGNSSASVGNSLTGGVSITNFEVADEPCRVEATIFGSANNPGSVGHIRK